MDAQAKNRTAENTNSNISNLHRFPKCFLHIDIVLLSMSGMFLDTFHNGLPNEIQPKFSFFIFKSCDLTTDNHVISELCGAHYVSCP